MTGQNEPDAAGPLSYEAARDLANNGDATDRAVLAARADIMPEVLYFLTDDPEHVVRRNLAQNEATPRQADVILARDKDDDVRINLSEKISRLIPGLPVDEKDKVYQATVETLEILARDQVVRVRQILAETLKDVASTPNSVIRQLAQDAELVVAEPILTFSPVLTDEDILDIISSNPIEGALNAITQRSSLSESLSDAIVEVDDADSIALLLGNDSAQIREETLDALIEKAPKHETWHEPLVKRPKLPFRAALSLARFVAENLVDGLQKRGDLPPEAVDDIKDIVSRRIGEGSFDPEWALGDSSKRDKELVDPDWDDSEGIDKPDVDDLWEEEGDKKKKKTRPVTP